MISRAVVTDRSVQPGNHCPDTRPTHLLTPAAEQRARQDVQERLAHRFPNLPPETLATAATEAFAFFADARVRHYVPVLAFKRAARQLSELIAALGDERRRDVKPTPKCVLDRSRPCNACIAPDPSSCPYPYLLAGDDTMDLHDDIDTDDDPAHAEK